jgi:hypothetical protein
MNHLSMNNSIESSRHGYIPPNENLFFLSKNRFYPGVIRNPSLLFHPIARHLLELAIHGFNPPPTPKETRQAHPDST